MRALGMLTYGVLCGLAGYGLAMVRKDVAQLTPLEVERRTRPLEGLRWHESGEVIETYPIRFRRNLESVN